MKIILSTTKNQVHLLFDFHKHSCKRRRIDCLNKSGGGVIVNETTIHQS